MLLDWSKCSVLESFPGKVSGALVFRGTRVPVSKILKDLKHSTLNQLIENYPSVSREQIESVLDFLAHSADPIFFGEPAQLFTTEAEEAEWWYKNRNIHGQQLLTKVKNGQAQVLTKAKLLERIASQQIPKAD